MFGLYFTAQSNAGQPNIIKLNTGQQDESIQLLSLFLFLFFFNIYLVFLTIKASKMHELGDGKKEQKNFPYSEFKPMVSLTQYCQNNVIRTHSYLVVTGTMKKDICHHLTMHILSFILHLPQNVNVGRASCWDTSCSRNRSLAYYVNTTADFQGYYFLLL